MKTKTSFFTLLGCLVAFALPARAQVEFETLSAFTGSITSFGNLGGGGTTGRALTQTFTTVSLVQSMTYRFASASDTFGSTNFNAYFTEWNPTTNTAIGPALYSTQITIPGSGSFTDFGDYNGFDYQFTLNAVTNPYKTYAMVLVNTQNTSIGLLNIDAEDAFSFGSNFSRSGIPVSSPAAGYTTLTSSASFGNPSEDWGFSSIWVTPAAVPEPQTAAAVFAAVFVAGLVCRRVWQRRQVAAQPVALAA